MAILVCPFLGKILLRFTDLGKKAYGELRERGGCFLWFENLWSFVCKLELLNQMNLQGLAMWEAGGYFPEVWSYLHEYFELE